jgi:hypothetical protein
MQALDIKGQASYFGLKLSAIKAIETGMILFIDRVAADFFG